jgi:hypothetical protein
MVIAWVMLTVATVGILTSLPPWRLLGGEEPLLVLLLSWFALWYEAFNAVNIVQDTK